MNKLFLSFALMITAAPGISSDQDGPESGAAQADFHEFRLVVVASGESEVPIQGSIASDTDNSGYVQISTSTPYEKTVHGRSIIAIVNSAVHGTTINVTLEVDGVPAIIGENDQLVVFGRDIPKPHSGFAVSF